MQELKNLDADKIAAREAEELLKEKKEQQQKLKMIEKKMDYFERAKRLEEIPLLKAATKEKQVCIVILYGYLGVSNTSIKECNSNTLIRNKIANSGSNKNMQKSK